MKMSKLLILAVIALALFSVAPVHAVGVCTPAYDNWSFRKNITLAMTGTTPISNLLINFTTDTATPISQGKMQADGGDIRFAFSDCVNLSWKFENSTNLTHGINTSRTLIWVNMSSTIQQDNSSFMYFFYGNPVAPDGFATGTLLPKDYVEFLPLSEGTGEVSQSYGQNSWGSISTDIVEGRYGNAKFCPTNLTGRIFTNFENSWGNLGKAGENYTIYLWAKFADTGQSNPTIVKLTTASPDNGLFPINFRLRDGGGAKRVLQAVVGASGTEVSAVSEANLAAAPNFANNNAWEFYAFTVNGTNLSAYLNGTFFAFSTTVDATNMPNNKNKTGTTEFCQNINATSVGNRLGGSIDTFAIVRRTLTSSELLSLFNDPFTRTQGAEVSNNPDIIAPVVNISQPVGLKNSQNVSISYTAIDETSLSQCYYELDSTANITLPNCINTTKIVADGSHSIKIFANDSSNNTGFGQSNFSVDTISPVVLIQSPSGLFSSQNISISFTATDANNISACKYELDGAANVTLNGCVNVTKIIADGSHSIKVFANDTANNFGFAQSNFTIDSVAPSVTIQSPSGTSPSANISISYTVSDSGVIDKCQYELDGTANVSLGSCFNTTRNISDGTHTIKIFANDTAGNTGNASRTFAVDTINPVVTIFSPSGFVSSTNVSFTFTAINNGNIDSCYYELDGAANVSIPACINFTKIIAQGLHGVKIFSNDSASNIGFGQSNFTVDTTNPTVTLSQPTGLKTSTNVSISYFTTDNFGVATCKYQLDDAANITINGCINVTKTVSSGLHTITLFAIDNAGNVGSATNNFTVDTTAPVISISSPSGSIIVPANQSNNFNLSLSYIVSDSLTGINSSTCKYSVNGGVNVTLTGCYNTTFVLNSRGDHTVTVSVFDGAGNYGQSISLFHIGSNAIVTGASAVILGIFGTVLALAMMFFAVTSMRNTRNSDDLMKSIVMLILGIVLLGIVVALTNSAIFAT